MPNKTITSIIATVIITIALIITGADEKLIYTALGMIAALGGIAIIRNTHTPR